jgi:hypothetical protein
MDFGLDWMEWIYQGTGTFAAENIVAPAVPIV